MVTTSDEHTQHTGRHDGNQSMSTMCYSNHLSVEKYTTTKFLHWNTKINSGTLGIRYY